MSSKMGLILCIASLSLSSWTITLRPSLGSRSLRTSPASSNRLIIPLIAPVVSPVRSASCPAVIGPVLSRISITCMSVSVIPLRAAAARKKDALSPLNCRNSCASSPATFVFFLSEPLDIFFPSVYIIFILITKINFDKHLSVSVNCIIAHGGITMMIEIQGLRKSFGNHLVLDDIDLNVASGTTFALLGPNGAGKTTMIQILSTLISADSGKVRVAGHDLDHEPDAIRAAIGVTGQFSAIDNLLTGEENLLLMADLHHLARSEGRRRATELLDRFDLTDAARKRPATYSGGMRRRLDLAMTLMGDPRIIFLDEPTTGLDPRSRQTMWQIIRDLVAGGVTILLTTQYLDEADQLADRIAVLDHGKLVAEGTPDELKRRIPGGHIRLQFADASSLALAASIVGDGIHDDNELTLQVPTDGSVRALRTVLDRLDHEEIVVDGVTVHTPDLDDVFFALTGHPETQKESVQ